MKHELKIWPKYFKEVVSGTKRFEIRKHDRNYQVGDILHLREWDPQKQSYTGNHCACKVTYILLDPSFVKAETVVMSIDLIDIKFRWVNS